MLKPNQRAYLRKLAQTITPIFQIGKNGISDNQIKQLIDALEARELIKINILNTSPSDKHSVADEIATKTDSEVVHVIGNKLTIYKRSINSPKIELP